MRQKTRRQPSLLVDYPPHSAACGRFAWEMLLEPPVTDHPRQHVRSKSGSLSPPKNFGHAWWLVEGPVRRSLIRTRWIKSGPEAESWHISQCRLLPAHRQQGLWCGDSTSTGCPRRCWKKSSTRAARHLTTPSHDGC